LPWSGTDESLEVPSEVPLVREAGVCVGLCQSEVTATLQELFGSLGAACDDVLVRR